MTGRHTFSAPEPSERCVDSRRVFPPTLTASSAPVAVWTGSDSFAFPRVAVAYVADTSLPVVWGGKGVRCGQPVGSSFVVRVGRLNLHAVSRHAVSRPRVVSRWAYVIWDPVGRRTLANTRLLAAASRVGLPPTGRRSTAHRPGCGWHEGHRCRSSPLETPPPPDAPCP